MDTIDVNTNICRKDFEINISAEGDFSNQRNGLSGFINIDSRVEFDSLLVMQLINRL